MPREQATALLQDYLDNLYPLLPVIHGSTCRSRLVEFYDRLSNSEPVEPSTAALILSISAASAYFWLPDAAQHGNFASAEEAEHASLVWRNWAFNTLMEPQASNSTTLEGVQSWAILSFMVQNADGCSHRFRFLHNCSLTAARELSLHLIDNPRSERNGDRITRELKRRLWWHIAATDW